MFGPRTTETPANANLGDEIAGYSIEVMPRTAAKVEDFKALLPAGTRVYFAHIDGTPIEEMVATARRLAEDGFSVMPHFPARIIADTATLADWIARYQGEADVTEALLLGGGVDRPVGEFDRAMQLVETGLFDKAGFTRLHVAGHPEGNRDIDPNGGTDEVDAALLEKEALSARTDAEMAIVTQFAFEAAPVLDWIARLREMGVEMPVHLGIAGPGKLQTLIKFALACGVGPSVRVLQRRAKDVTRLLKPFEPTEVIADLAAARAEGSPNCPEKLHFFPLGGIRTCAEWAARQGGGHLRAVG